MPMKAAMTAPPYSTRRAGDSRIVNAVNTSRA